MASAQVKGKVSFYRVTPTKSREFLFSGNLAALGPSGSSDGTIASTPEKWLNLPVIPKTLNVNDHLVVTLTLAVAGTTDASDAEWSIPITYADGGHDILGSPDDSTVWDVAVLGDTAFLAGVETDITELTVRRPFRLGGGKIFCTVEDNS